MSEQSISNMSTKCSEWLDRNSFDFCETESSCSEFSSTTDFSKDSDLTENSAMESGFIFHSTGTTNGNLMIQQTTNEGANNFKLSLSNGRKEPSQSIQIYKSRKVHIGDVNYINGPIYVTQVSSQSDMKYTPVNQSDFESNITRNQTTSHRDNRNTTNERTTQNDDASEKILIIGRRTWLAQPAIEMELLKEPAKHVVICHSATEEAFTQAENTLLVRLIQGFHMDSRGWSDIAYNFLIGGDGTVYEGRGWKIRGSFAHQYNSTSIGICFIGTFILKPPSLKAMTKAQQLIDEGVEIGAIDPKFSLLGHCQCSGTESPGRALFAEMKKWRNFNSSVSLFTPSIVLPSLKRADDVPMP